MSVSHKIVGCAILFLLTACSGIWLSSLGKPYNTSVFTLHKLIALATVVFTVIVVRGFLADIGTASAPSILLVVSAALVLTLFVTGALLSVGKPESGIILILHKTTPVFAIFTAGIAIYQLARKILAASTVNLK